MTPREEDVLDACREICRTLGTEALMRIEIALRPDESSAVGIKRRHWLIDQRETLKRALALLGEAL